MSEHTPDAEKITLGATEETTVTGTDGSQDLTCRVDTGAKRSCIDSTVAETIGSVATDESKNFRSAHDESENRPIETVTVEIRDRTHHIPVSVKDRSGLSTDIRIGRDVLMHGYVVDVSRQD